ncbi:MAG: hypothetical protein Q9M36_12535 [Sulfurovum sp.]|nr:hypothetical protein [Sulfurovum sp.]
MTKASTAMTTSILRQTQVPQGFADLKHHIAYKTGTSYGYRDAWTVAYTKEYTVTVWVGKPDNSIQLKRTGMHTSAPLAFEVHSIIDALLVQKHWTQDPYFGTHSPRGLQYFDKKSEAKEVKFSFISPQEGARFMSADCTQTIVEVQVSGGEAPYFAYVDNLPQEMQEDSVILPLPFGGHYIQVIDTLGNTIHRNIWVNQPEC